MDDQTDKYMWCYGISNTRGVKQSDLWSAERDLVLENYYISFPWCEVGMARSYAQADTYYYKLEKVLLIISFYYHLSECLAVRQRH